MQGPHHQDHILQHFVYASTIGIVVPACTPNLSLCAWLTGKQVGIDIQTADIRMCTYPLSSPL